MPSSLTSDLKSHFEMASFKQLADKHLRGDDWKKLQDIKEDFAKRRDEAEQTYSEEYAFRVSAVKKYLIDKAASKPRDFKHRWFGQDRFSKSAITHHAQRIVRNTHRMTLAGIDKQERKAIDKLVDKSEQRQVIRDKLAQDFSRATDRRRGQDRRRDDRQPSSPTRSR